MRFYVSNFQSFFCASSSQNTSMYASNISLFAHNLTNKSTTSSAHHYQAPAVEQSNCLHKNNTTNTSTNFKVNYSCHHHHLTPSPPWPPCFYKTLCGASASRSCQWQPPICWHYLVTSRRRLVFTAINLLSTWLLRPRAFQVGYNKA